MTPAPDPSAQVDAYLDDLADGLRAPRRAKRKVRKAGGVTLTPAQRRTGQRWAESLARRELPAETTKAKRGAKVLKGQRARGGMGRGRR